MMLLPEVTNAAQTNETGHIAANVVTPITVTETQGLNFGTMTDESGEVTIHSDGTRTSESDNLIADDNIPTVGEFAILGPASQRITISVPTNATITSTNSANIIVDLTPDFHDNDNTSTIGPSGSLVIKVGGSLNPDGASRSNYTGTYTITINY